MRFWREVGGFGIGERACALLDGGAAVVASAAASVAGGAASPDLPVSPAPCLRLVALPDGVATTEETAGVLYRALSALGVETQVLAYGGRGWIRLSGAVYNVPADYERLAEVLPAALGG